MHCGPGPADARVAPRPGPGWHTAGVDSSRLTGPPMPLRLGGEVLPMVGRVRMYVCGITPYDVTHLGHAATYVWADAADRVLRWHGHTVTLARNVTDVDEVLFAEARRRGESPSMLATLQRASFEATMAALRVRIPDHSPTAAQAVGHVIQLAAALLARDAAYLRGGTVYARTSSAAGLAGLDQATALALSHEYHDHPDDPAKDDPLDVAVWQETTDEEVSWPSPWGDGRPGWHAECAAMVLALFGPSVDLHCGGADLAYPHHACEAALAEAATGVTPFSRAWLRAGTVGVDGAKMAKSTGNLVLVDDLLREHTGGRGPAAVPEPALGPALVVHPGRARRRGRAARRALRGGGQARRRHRRGRAARGPARRPRRAARARDRPRGRRPGRPHADRDPRPELSSPELRARCRGNSTTCWNVGRFCQSIAGWPIRPSARNWIASNTGIVCPAALAADDAVQLDTFDDPLAVDERGVRRRSAASIVAGHVAGPPAHSRLVISVPNPSAGCWPSSCCRVATR